MLVKNTKSLHVNSLKALVYGEPGAGKTTLAGTLRDKTLIVSAEAGLLSLNGKDIDVIDISQDDNGGLIPKELRIKRLGEVYQYLLTPEANKKYKNVFIDSLTEISQNLLEQLEVEFPDRKDSLVKYGENAKRMRSLVKSFRDLTTYNVVFTALSEKEKDESGRYYLGISMPGKFSQVVPAMFDEVFYLHTHKLEDGSTQRVLVTKKTDTNVCKDRSGACADTESPDLGMIFDKIRNHPPIHEVKTKQPTQKEAVK